MVTHYEKYKAPEELVSESFEGLERQFVPIPFVAKSFLPYFPLLLHCKCLYSNYSHGIVKTNQNYKQLLIELNTYKIYTFYSHSIVLLCFEHIETSIIWL